MVDLISATTGVSTGFATESDVSAASLADDFDDFLTLLTTQLQNQDPTSPMDSNEFTQQLVQFSQVEQQIRSNQNLETLGALMQINNVSSAAAFLGSDALIIGDTGDHDGATGITWQYQNPLEAETVTLEVFNSAGDLVYSQQGETSTGLHTFEWSGVDNAGEMAPLGDYALKITAEDEEGDEIVPAVAVQDTIHAVDTSGFEPVFTVGPNTVGQTEILQLVNK